MPIRRALRRHEAAHLRQQRQQRHLADEVDFAAHVRSGNEQKHAVVRPQQHVVGHERARRQRLVEHGMPAVAISSIGSSASSGRQYAATAASSASAASTSSVASTSAVCSSRLRLRRHLLAQGCRNRSYSRWLDLLLGGEDLLLVLLQLRRDVALGVLERLLALIVGRDLRGVACA